MAKSGQASARVRGRSAVTLADVAQHAGVSVSTAARTLRDANSKVDPTLAAKVLAAAKELDYVPNLVARSLRGGGPATVGLVVGDMLDPYYGEIAESITEAAESDYGMAAIVSNMQRSPLLEIQQCRQLWSHRVAGLILAGGGFDQRTNFDEFARTIAQIQRSGVAVVSLAPRGLPDLPVFAVDNRRVGSMMVERLAGAGHRRFGVLTGPMSSEATRQRVSGITDAIGELGGEVEVLHGDYTTDSGEALATQLFAARSSATAIIAGADAVAFGVLAAARHWGRRVPEDVSLISTGSTRLGRLVSPTITSIDLHLSEFGRLALGHIESMVNGSVSTGETTIEPTLVEGESIAAPARP